MAGKDEAKHKVSKTIESFFHSLSNLLSKQVIVFFNMYMYIRISLLNLYMYIRISQLTQAIEPFSFFFVLLRIKDEKKNSITTKIKYKERWTGP